LRPESNGGVAKPVTPTRCGEQSVRPGSRAPSGNGQSNFSTVQEFHPGWIFVLNLECDRAARPIGEPNRYLILGAHCKPVVKLSLDSEVVRLLGQQVVRCRDDYQNQVIGYCEVKRDSTDPAQGEHRKPDREQNKEPACKNKPQIQ